jgi:gliding motility-associated-like protein
LSTGGTAIAGEVNNNYTTPIIAATTAYFVSINDGVCEGARTAVTVTIQPVPSAPSTTGASGVGPVSLTLTASGASNGQFRWYTTAVGGTAIAGAVNSTYTTPILSATTTYYVSINNGCEGPRTAVSATVLVNHPPSISATSAETTVQGQVTIDLGALVSDIDNDLDFSSLTIVSQPISGAQASIDAQHRLLIDYTGVSFTGTDRLTIRICDTQGACTQQEITIEVAGDVIVYNALSPNGDGLNEFFYLEHIDLLPETRTNHVTIFNRWGDIVFEVNDYDNNERVFRGFNRQGEKLPVGSYYYKIEYASGSRMGYISLKH